VSQSLRTHPADVAAASPRYRRALAWAEENLPEEHGPFVASAALTIESLTGSFPKSAEVSARLKWQGRDKASLDTELKQVVST
jgi:hypothetical protein